MRQLGRTGVRVSPYCLGTMMFGRFGNPDHDACSRIVHRALDAGINFVDTADMYSAGESEEIVGKALAGRRDDVILATKFSLPMGDEPNTRGGSRRWIMRACEDSLRRLGTDWIDLYQLHKPDEHTEIDETLGALSDLVHQGKVRYIGHSTFRAETIVEAHWVAERRRRERFVCEQPPYSIFMRGIERGVLSTAARYGMGVIGYSPLAGGWLAGRYRRGRAVPADSRLGSGRLRPATTSFEAPVDVRRLDAVEELAAVADQAGLPLAHMAYSFVLEHPAVTSAIMGPRTMEQLEDALACVDVRLDTDVLDRIDEINPPGTDLVVVDRWAGPGLRAENRRRPR
jgi:aryl-alcohol dehydrogenase-like predicted oxidoreductase